MGKTIKTVSLAVVALAVVYLGYQLFERKVDPCEGIFQQSSVTLGTKLDVIKAKGEFSIGRQKVQDLTERSQQMALNLKTCCIVLGNKSTGEFLRCKEGFDKYDAEIKKVANSVEEAEAAKKQNKPEIAAKKTAEANEGLKATDAAAQAFTEQISQIKEKGPTEGRKEEKSPTDGRKPGESVSSAECCRTFANPNLKGLGRIVVAFPEGSKPGYSYVAIFKPGDTNKIAGHFGGIGADLVPGQYEVDISGGRVGGVAVQAGHDTKIRAGILRVKAGSDTYPQVFQRGGKDRLVGFFGSRDVGLPVGEYDVEVAGQRAPVAIKEDTITEF